MINGDDTFFISIDINRLEKSEYECVRCLVNEKKRKKNKSARFVLSQFLISEGRNKEERKKERKKEKEDSLTYLRILL